MAAARSQTGEQLNQYLEQLRPLAGGNVFVILGGAVPSWDLAGMAPGEGKTPSQVGAMETIIDLAESPEIALKRILELVSLLTHCDRECGSIEAAEDTGLTRGGSRNSM